MPEDDDFTYYAAHVGGTLVIIPLGCASFEGPTTFGVGSEKLVLGMLEQAGVMHVELISTNMHGETSDAWPSKALLVRQPWQRDAKHGSSGLEPPWCVAALGW